jgi:hypothetical protein
VGDPVEVGRVFADRIGRLVRDYDELLLAVHQKRRQASLETMLSEQTAMSLAVYWESFLSDILVSHIARSPKQCRKVNNERITKSIAEKFPGSLNWISVETPDTPSADQIEKMLDPKGWNVTFKSAQSFRDQANLWLEASDARKFALNADDSAFFDYFIAIRNYLGHRSDASRRIVLHAVTALNPQAANAELRAPAQHLGMYLKQVTPSGRRINSIGARALAIAGAIAT